MKTLSGRLVAFAILLATAILSSCASGGGYHSTYHPGVGYGGYYGRPWGHHPGYVVAIDPGPGMIDPGPGFSDGPSASQLPDMGMPDMGGGMDMGMAMDMGGFDF